MNKLMDELDRVPQTTQQMKCENAATKKDNFRSIKLLNASSNIENTIMTKKKISETAEDIKTLDNFTYKKDDINSSFALAIKNFVKYSDTDIFPFPYETRMFSDIFNDILI